MIDKQEEIPVAERTSDDQISLLRGLYRLRRDIVSDGYDQAIAILARRFPLQVREYASGTKCWTWTIPEKWSCDEAYIETLDGRRLVDQADNALHVASYSESVDSIVSREDLLKRVHVHPNCPNAVPFVFYYYDRTWAFSLTHAQRDDLVEQSYRVVIRSRFEDSTLKVGEWFLPGDSAETFVIGTNLCHPCQVNDSLSGVATGTAVMKALASRSSRRYSYLMLITPENIGATAWLSHNEAMIEKMFGGVFLEMTGLRQPPALQRSFMRDTVVDRVLAHVHRHAEEGAWQADYRGVVGNDERQFNAPGVRVPMLSYSRALPWGHEHRPFREYHSDADNLEVTGSDELQRSRDTVLAMIDALESNVYPHPKFRGEPFLSGYNLSLDRFHNLAAIRKRLAMLDFMDGEHAVIDIAERLDLPFDDVLRWVDMLAEVGLVEKAQRAQSAR